MTYTALHNPHHCITESLLLQIVEYQLKKIKVLVSRGFGHFPFFFTSRVALLTLHRFHLPTIVTLSREVIVALHNIHLNNLC